MKMPRQWVALIAVLAVAGFAAGAVAASSGQGAAMQKLTEARTALVEAKAGLDNYECCINPGCSFCALAAGMCPCGDNVDTEEGVCGECFLGWQAGQGSVYGIQADLVQPLQGELLQRMYEWRVESMRGDRE